MCAYMCVRVAMSMFPLAPCGHTTANIIWHKYTITGTGAGVGAAHGTAHSAAFLCTQVHGSLLVCRTLPRMRPSNPQFFKV